MENASIINLVTLSFSNYGKPKLQINSKDWVLNGRNNSYYNYIMDRNTGSPTGASVNRTYAELIVGKGLYAKNAHKNVEDNANLKNQLRQQDYENIAYDFQIFGEFTFFVTKKNNNGLKSITHVPNHLVVPEKENADGVIEAYWYCKDWSNTRKNTPIRYPAFGSGSKGKIQVYKTGIYSPEQTYFFNPDYQAALQYMEAEEEISNMNLTSVKNGLSAGYIINVPNAINWTADQKKEFKKKVEERLTGSSNTSQFIISYNGVDVEIKVTPFPVNENIHKQWESLNNTCAQKILTGFRCTSPSIAGIVSSSGFSNTADEMDTAEFQLIKRVIQPKRKLLLNSFEDVLNQFEIMLELDFLPLTEEVDPLQASVEIPLSLKSEGNTRQEVDDATTDSLIALGEELENDWICIAEDDSKEITLTEDALNQAVKLMEFALPKDSNIKDDSKQDTSLFKVRYRYSGNKKGERNFCNKMLKANLVYKAEDLDKNIMTAPKMGPNGSDTYNVFLYKGGVNCNHFWKREIYLKKNNERISVNSAIKMINLLEPSERRKAKWEQNPKEVAQAADEKNNFWRLKKKK
jgi:uncharacterized protein Usg